jgi:Bacterial transcriptional activator domain
VIRPGRPGLNVKQQSSLVTFGGKELARFPAGLRIDPADERLWRALMRAEHEAGRPAAVKDAWNACLAVLADIALDGQPHQDTPGPPRRAPSA